MENTLKHSIYLTEHREEILQEDSSASINDSAKKRPLNYHPFAITITNTTDLEESTNQHTYRKTISDLHQQDPPSQNRSRIERPCHNSYRALLNQQKLMLKPKVDRRDKLCSQRQDRRAERLHDFKSKLLRRIKFEGSEEVESSIQEQIVEGLQARLQKVGVFLKRQQFYEQERQILKEMRQFCQYGAIKIT